MVLSRRHFLQLAGAAAAGALVDHLMPSPIGLGYTVPGGGGGGGGTPTLRTLTSSPHAGWTQIPDPKAFYDSASGKTFFGPWVHATSGDIEAQGFDSAGAAIGSPFALHSALAPLHDNHNSGSIIARRLGSGAQADGKLVSSYTGHDGGSHLVRISSSAADATAFGTEQNFGSGDFTYETLIQLASGTIYRFYRNYSGGTGRLAYQPSTDGGVTWGSEVLLYTGASGHVPYWRIVSDWNTRIDFFVTDVEPTGSSLYHFYMTASGRFKSDGTSIATSLPLTVADLTLVLNNSGGPCWSWGGSWDGSAPATIIMQSLSGTDCKILRGKWSGSAWVIETIVPNVGGILATNQYGSGCGIHHENPDICLISKKAPGGRWNIWLYQRTGGVWAGTQLTFDSSVDNVWADFPVHCDLTKVGGFWLHGTYSADNSYSFGIGSYYLL